MWSSVHGDAIGAFKTGLLGAITKLLFTNKDILIGGTWYSLLILWQIFETTLTPIAKKAPGTVNGFETILGKYEEQKAKQEEEENDVEEEKNNEPKKKMEQFEQIESLDNDF